MNNTLKVRVGKNLEVEVFWIGYDKMNYWTEEFKSSLFFHLQVFQKLSVIMLVMMAPPRALWFWQLQTSPGTSTRPYEDVWRRESTFHYQSVRVTNHTIAL